MDHLIDKPLGCHAAGTRRLGTSVCSEDDETLLAARIQRHEHVHARLLLHSAQLTATVPGDPAFAVRRDVHFCGVLALRHVWDRYAPSHLLQQPANELFATPTLFQRSGNEGDVAHKLQDGTSGLF